VAPKGAKESPDSTEQCTGEQPGGAQAPTDSATENYCHAIGVVKVKT